MKKIYLIFLVILFPNLFFAQSQETLSAIPMDTIQAEQWTTIGASTLDQALVQLLPSFNSFQIINQNATSLINPYELRNLGSSRTLVLINGKRKNTSALLYREQQIGVGEVGVNFSVISPHAIERIEVLNDGASARYGSDAVAGVINIVLKEQLESKVKLQSGITSAGDGAFYGVVFNHGLTLGKKGFITGTFDYLKTYPANRAGIVDIDSEIQDFFNSGSSAVVDFLTQYPDALNQNASPTSTAVQARLNAEYNLSKSTKFYGNIAYSFKEVNSLSHYRTSYWRSLSTAPYLSNFFLDGPNGEYIGYQPTFDGILQDYNGTIGYQINKNGWTSDFSITTGGNEQLNSIRNSLNRSNVIVNGIQQYRANSPTEFQAGGTRFQQYLTNIDIHKTINKQLNVAFGAEAKREIFTIIGGDIASFEARGADSFVGRDTAYAGVFNRDNIGGYAQISVNATDNLVLTSAVRLEYYSDFGLVNAWNANAKYTSTNEKIALHGAMSSNFRAPSAHQIYEQNHHQYTRTGFTTTYGGLLNHSAEVIQLMEVPTLIAEKTRNRRLGISLHPSKKFQFTFDYYNILIKNRIVQSSFISQSGADNALNTLLVNSDIHSVKFFINALDTQTSGIESKIQYQDIPLGKGQLSLQGSVHYGLKNERIGALKTPILIEEAGETLVDANLEALLFRAHPRYKAHLGAVYSRKKWNIRLANTLFGSAQFKQIALHPDLYTEFKPKIVTDFGIQYQLSSRTTIQLNINNLFNSLPEWTLKAENADGELLLDDADYIKRQENIITFNQRYTQMTRGGAHFNQWGTTFNLMINMQF